MFKHILIPVDGSTTAALAVDKAIALAKAFSSDVTAIYVIDPYPFTGVGADFAYGQSQYLSAATAEANASLAAARKAIEDAGVVVKTTVVEGHSIHRGILDTAETLGSDLIVMGSHGRRGIEKLVLGSVAQKVLSDAHLPVMVVRD
ncbi:MAG: universal stress protein [Curvibacter sp.]|nr:universal stress protein [Curvibacter sp.]